MLLRTLLMGAAALLTTACAAQDWPTWRGPNLNGITTDMNFSYSWPKEGPKRLWEAATGRTYSAVSVSGGRAYTMGEADGKDTVFCFDAETGRKIWAYSYAHPKRAAMADPNPTATTATPVVDGDRVYTISREGLVLCLNAASGRVLWQKDAAKASGAAQLQFGFSGSALVLGKRVLFNVGSSGIALDKMTGTVLWSSRGEAGYGSVIPYRAGGLKGVAMTHGTGMVGVDPDTGKVQWRHTWKTQYDVNAIDPLFVGDEFLMSAYGKAQKVSLRGGRPAVVAETRHMQDTFITPIQMDGHLYGNSKGRLACMEWKSARQTWDVAGFGSGTVIAAGTKLLALFEKGELVVVEADPSKYTELARAKVLDGKCWIQPTLANGRLYCRTIEGSLVCLDVRR
jgi:outer membrane protein assembly factor BamB